MSDMPTLYLSDLIRREGAFKADVISRGDDTWNLTFWFKGGKQAHHITARCRIVLPHEETRCDYCGDTRPYLARAHGLWPSCQRCNGV